MIDYTKLIRKLDKDPMKGNGPTSDPDPGLRLRTATVDAVNSDGTVDLILSGGLVPDVAVLDGAVIDDEAVVQVLVARGIMLVLGGSAGGSFSKSEVAAAGNITTASGSYTAFAGADIHGTTFVAPATGIIKLTLSGWLAINHSSIAARAFMAAQVREGAVINSGTIVNSPVDTRAAMSQNSVVSTYDYRYVSISYLIPNLVPGDTYNIVSMVKTGGAGTAATQDRRMLVEPW
jgi:hypothetical protein